MKKTRLLAVTLVVAIMLMGAGYAYWSDQLVICSTVETGNLEVEYLESSNNFFMNPDIYLMDNNSIDFYAEASIETTNNKLMTVRITELYPGVGARFHMIFKNSGTIPAIFDFAQFNPAINANEDLIELLAYKANYVHYNENLQQIGYDFIYPGAAEADLNNLPTDLDSLFTRKGVLRLEPGEYVKLEMEIWLPSYVDNDDDVENATAVFDIQLNFQQFIP